MNRQALVFTAPGRVEVVDEPLPAPGPGQVVVRTVASAISAGTELLAFRGQLAADLALDEALGAMRGDTFQYPFRYGYASLGQVVEVGPNLDARALRDQWVFALHPHASAFVAGAAELVRVPPALVPPATPGPERAVLLAAMETAHNLVLDAAPLLGERVVVMGQGTVGLLTTALLAGFPLESLVAVEAVPLRAQAARALGAHQVLAPEAALEVLGSGKADLVIELSGNPAALDTAIALCGQEARVVVGSWYGTKRAPVDLGGVFHRRRLTLKSSQVSQIPPALAPRWDRLRRFAAAFRALAALDPAPLVTHRFNLTDAQAAYDLLDREPASAIQVLLVPAT